MKRIGVNIVLAVMMSVFSIQYSEVSAKELTELVNDSVTLMTEELANVSVTETVTETVTEMDAGTVTETVTEMDAEKVTERTKQPTKGLLFFYRTGNWVDNYLRRGIDTSYIDLPEFSWRLAYTNAMVGVHSSITSSSILPGYGENIFSLVNKTTPSVDLGFYAGYRGFGFGYSWDAVNAYARRLSFSFGSKFIGLDFAIQTSTNITTKVLRNGHLLWDNGKTGIVLTNANLNVWYALNAVHYSHQAAVKQSYIQKKTAGSLLLHLSYMSSHVELTDTMKVPDAQRPLIPAIMSNTTAVRTRQVAVGIGYGINYTPNHGKVLLHVSGAAMLVAYSVNHISYYLPDSLQNELPGTPMFTLKPSFPVHVTGNMRAAVSWEINRWVHLNAWATVDHIRFRSQPTAQENVLGLSNWNWKVQASVGVRFGAGKERRQRALGIMNEGVQELKSEGDSRYLQWLTDYFWSPKK